ncbi:MAG: hypothetical protein CME71_11105 [Halobacteriovorax sp.]|nr:hypothetical protein [Halobacteriovorax sp.]
MPFFFEVSLGSIYLEEAEREEFLAQAVIIIEKLQLDIEDFEDDPSDFDKLRSFIKSIDRMILQAKLFDLASVVAFCDTSKVVGQKLIRCDNCELNTIAAGVLADTVDLINKLVQAIGAGESSQIANDYASFQGRLKILSNKFKALEASTQNELSKEASELDSLIAVLDDL